MLARSMAVLVSGMFLLVASGLVVMVLVTVSGRDGSVGAGDLAGVELLSLLLLLVAVT